MSKEKLSFYELFYIFISGCLMGYVVEGIWSLFKRGILINHTSLVLGPFNLVYGFSAVILTIFLYRFKNRKNIEIFLMSFSIGTILEYIMSFGMEKVFGFIAWNYSKKPFNINGRICLLYSIFWGILGLIWLKKLLPKVLTFIRNGNKESSIKLMKYLIIFLIFDIVLTLGAIDRGHEYDMGIKPQNKIDEIYDKYFGVDYLNNMFNNRWNKK